MKKYAIIGVSGRSMCFINNILETYKDDAVLVALLDSNSARMTDLNETKSLDLPAYNENEFSKMIKETSPDAVIISTTDSTHHKYIIEAMQHNVEAISEKPMTIDAEKVRTILDAEKKSKASVQVTFNYRYSPLHTKIREMILDGAIGRPTHVDFNYYLDTFHGASYFKRWNRYANQGGSLLITKACHHFDLVNWWLDMKPKTVFAFGKLNYYGADAFFNPGKKDGRRCSTCTTKCQYFLRHSNGSNDEHLINFNNKGKNEKFGKVDGYFADRCIFDSDIDTWDTFTVSVLYDGGAVMSYSLNASVPYEGYRLAINGTEGRLESKAIHYGKDPSRIPFPPPPPQNIRYFPMFDAMQTIGVINKGGGHGGGDPILYKEIFLGKDRNDRLERFAGSWDGAMSVLLGTAARESLKTGKAVEINNLLKKEN